MRLVLLTDRKCFITQDVHELMETPPVDLVPEFTVHEQVAYLKLLDTTQGSIRLKSLANLIEKKGKDFEKNWDAISAEISFMSW